jgi:hypothetical protein
MGSHAERFLQGVVISIADLKSGLQTIDVRESLALQAASGVFQSYRETRGGSS